jgi:hypothetical protein
MSPDQPTTVQRSIERERERERAEEVEESEIDKWNNF